MTSHLPTGMLIIGTLVFWLELLVLRLPGGQTSPLAWGLWLLLAVVVSAGNFPRRFDRPVPKTVWVLGVLVLVYLGIVFLASLLPPHLPQEYDAINYHITVPRQHLIRHDWQLLSWSVADLFFLPLDYALSPFWLSTLLPNKFPQFVFLLGALAMVFSIVYGSTDKNVKKAAVAVVAVMAMHMTAIQSATAMLDVVMLYCFLAAIHSVMEKNYTMAAIEGAFFFWSKSFIPPMMVVILLGLWSAVLLLNYFGFRVSTACAHIQKSWKKILGAFIVSSLVIAGPFLIRSMYYTGSPIYGIRLFKPIATTSSERLYWMDQRITDHLNIIDGYGHGRQVLDFIKHFWLIAVPEKGVNNAFDYPVGLIYLLVLVPFIVSVVAAFRSKKIPVLSVIVLFWWALWWMGSQQTRFLLIPICLIIVLAIIDMKQLSRIFIALVVAAMMLEIISLLNAHRPDWGKSAYSVLRDKDKALLDMAKAGGVNAPRVLDYPDVAFASFPVVVRNNQDNIFVFP